MYKTGIVPQSKAYGFSVDMRLFMAAMLLLVGAITGGAAAKDASTLRTDISDMPWDPSALAIAPKVIYGTDDRIDVYEETDSNRLDWAAAVCAIVDASDLVYTANNMYVLSTSAYRQGGKPPCDAEPFGAQPTAAFCSAFMADENIMVTAGHCLDELTLPHIRFLFGFEMIDATTPVPEFHSDQIYTGVEIISYVSAGVEDHAVVRTDRRIVAPDAHPLPVRQDGVVAVNVNVGVIGHPWGLPKKIAFGPTTVVRDNEPATYFVANLDTYGGNSGSPVFNADTGLVEGILVRGATDFVIDTEADCFRSNVLPDDGGRGEDVTKSAVFAAVIMEPNGGEGETGEGEGETGEGEEEWAPVPNLSNLTPNLAEILLAESGFVLGDVTEEYHDAVDEGLVISQMPEADTPAPPDAVVSIVVSLGAEYVAAPALTNMSRQEAEAALHELSLILGVVDERYHPEIVAGLVISQSPVASSSVARDSAVHIVLSQGPEPVTIEGESVEGENEDVGGCCDAPCNPDVSSKRARRLLGDWLLIGLALLTVAGYSLSRRNI